MSKSSDCKHRSDSFHLKRMIELSETQIQLHETYFLLEAYAFLAEELVRHKFMPAPIELTRHKKTWRGWPGLGIFCFRAIFQAAPCS